MRARDAPAPRVDRASATLRDEIVALRRRCDDAPAPRDDVVARRRRRDDAPATPSRDAVVERLRARVRALERELAREREAWTSTCARQATELRALAASAESRARVAREDADAATRARDRALDALATLRRRRADEDAARAKERAALETARRADDARAQRRALVRWIEGACFNIAARGALERMRARRARAALTAWRGAAAAARLGRATRLRLAARAFRHWSLCVEVSGMCARARVARALMRWKSYRASDDGGSDDGATTREKCLALVARARRRETARGAFAAWLVALANAKRARAVAGEIARDRADARASLARLKARRDGDGARETAEASRRNRSSCI